MSLVSCMQLQPDDVDYSSHGITSSKLLKRAVLNMGYPPAITCAITYREELRRIGRPVWVRLDLLGARKELTFMCKAYEEADCQRGNGELKLTNKATVIFEEHLQHLHCDHSLLWRTGCKLTTHCLFCSCAFHSLPCH